MSPNWKNWARTERSTPALEISPRSAKQVAAAVARARETGHPVKAIGASHSFTAIGATDGIRLRMDRLRGLVDADLATGRVTLWAGTHLYELPALLEPLGLALANMGDIDRQTISGAVSTGTHGTGLVFGGLATQVVGATLVTGTGETLTVVRDGENAELLPAVALGLGALGILVTVTLQCVPAFLLRAVERPMPLGEAVQTFQERCAREDHFEFYWFPHTESARTKTNTRLPADGPRAPLGRVSRYVDETLVSNTALRGLVSAERLVPRATPRVNRMIQSLSANREFTDVSSRVFVTKRTVKFREMEYAVPLADIPEVLAEIRTVIDRNRFTVSFPIEVRSAAADDLWLSTASGRDSGYVAVHRFWRENPEPLFRAVEAVFRAAGGRPHWGKMHTRTAEDFRELYPRFDDFVAVRDRLDPGGVFRNPYLDRVLGVAPGA
ncbi:D-arabinono-1,4-lactone oxidase [Leucobacter sp. M11]|uniref:D-arabinono-1,4-lactone oxidase n=1 Tax=Leucobacter sp. M11 TaxID=2993565 RepID=UPI002D80903A|nr:D-arabinono-1,4-lactone oxidase [Leucobacter sp. M11]MEB4613919.1 FAD-binding protein [Leucobacter sp. M11]